MSALVQPSQQASQPQPLLAPARPAQNPSTSSAISQFQSQRPTAAIAASTAAHAAVAPAGVRVLLRSPLRTPQSMSAREGNMSVCVPVVPVVPAASGEPQAQPAAQGVSDIDILLTLSISFLSSFLSIFLPLVSRSNHRITTDSLHLYHSHHHHCPGSHLSHLLLSLSER